MSRVFVDTNVLVYARDNHEPVKREKALQILRDPELQLVLSTQVLIEFFSVVTRRLAEPLDLVTAQRAVDQLSVNEVIVTDAVVVSDAIATSISSQISIWDALIITAARVGGCDTLFTEDLQDGAVIAGVRVENPFRVDAGGH